MLSEEEKQLLAGLANKFRTGYGERPRNPLLILTSNELLPKTLYNRFSEYENFDKPYQQDLLGILCDFTIEKHLGLQTWSDIQLEHWKKRHQTFND